MAVKDYRQIEKKSLLIVEETKEDLDRKMKAFILALAYRDKLLYRDCMWLKSLDDSRRLRLKLQLKIKEDQAAYLKSYLKNLRAKETQNLDLTAEKIQEDLKDVFALTLAQDWLRENPQSQQREDQLDDLYNEILDKLGFSLLDSHNQELSQARRVYFWGNVKGLEVLCDSLDPTQDPGFREVDLQEELDLRFQEVEKSLKAIKSAFPYKDREDILDGTYKKEDQEKMKETLTSYQKTLASLWAQVEEWEIN